MKIAARIWSGIGVILIAYIGTVVVGAVLASKTNARLAAAREQAFPATLAAAGAIPLFQRQRATYQTAVEVGEADLVKAAGEPASQVLKLIDQIQGGTWISSERHNDIQALHASLDQLRVDAPLIYVRLASNDKDAQLPKLAGELNDRFNQAEKQLGELANAIKADAEAVLSDVAVSSLHQRTISIFVLIGSLVVSIIVVSQIVSLSVLRPLQDLNSAIGAIADGQGDLTRRLPVKTKLSGAVANDELNTLGSAMNRFLTNLQQIISKVGETTNQVGAAASDIATASHDVSANAEATRNDARTVQAGSSQVVTDMEQVNESVGHMMQAIREISQNAQKAASVSADAVDAVNNADATMGKLIESSQAIGEVVNLIKHIASRTNLLALNAAIEAASAGDAGRGFAVVANEVKTLARQTAEAVTTIERRIGSIRTDTAGANADLIRIKSIIEDISMISTSIAGAVEQQTATTQGMERIIAGAKERAETIRTDIDAVSARADANADASRRLEEAARGLASAAKLLSNLVGKFTV